MKVWYDATTYPTTHRKTGVNLVPGELDLPDAKAKILIKAGLVSPVNPPAPTEETESASEDPILASDEVLREEELESPVAADSAEFEEEEEQA